MHKQFKSRLLSAVCAFAALSLLAACTQDDDHLSDATDTIGGDLQEYTFDIGMDYSMEGEGDTRATSTTDDDPTRCFMQVFNGTETVTGVLTDDDYDDGFTFTVLLNKYEEYTFCFWADNGTQEITSLTEVPYTPGNITFAYTTEGTPETVAASGIKLAHAVAKVSLKTTNIVPANTKLSVTVPETYLAYNVQTGEPTGEIQEYKHETTVNATINGTTGGTDVFSFYTLVTEGAQTVTIDNGTSSKEVSASLAPSHHIILTGSAGIEGLEIDKNGTYIVSTAEALMAWGNHVNAGNWSTSCTLAADIDMAGQSWSPIGGGNNYYSGIFDGAGHTISGLTISIGNTGEVGLFGSLNGTVKNLHIREGNYSNGINYTGGIAAFCFSGTISGCSFYGKINNAEESGGIVGHLTGTGTVIACYSSGSVEGLISVGGIVGSNYGTLTACYSTATATVTAGDELNGVFGIIAGTNDPGTLSACYWSGTGSGVGTNYGTDDTHQVTGNVTWSTAMNAMNTALNNTDYKYEMNDGSDSSSFPLLITFQ